MAYIFGGNTGISYEELKRRQAVAAAQAARARPYPKTIGEGIYSLGESVGDVFAQRGLREAEAAQLARDKAGLAGPTGAVAPAPPLPKVSSYAPNEPARDFIAAALVNQGNVLGGPRPGEVAQENPTVRADPSAPGSDDWTARENAIAGLESSGRYNALGPVTRKGDRAYGKYQVMGANVGPWTEEVLGQRLTPQQFLTSKQAQDAVFRHRFGDYVNKYGEEGAARAWFGGEGNIDKPQARDQLGTSVGSYGQNYLSRLGGTPTRGGGALALASTGVTSDALPVLPRVGGPEEPEPTPTDIQPMPIRVAQATGAVVPGTRTTIQPYPDPGPEPKPPGQTASMRHWLEMAQDRARYSDEARAEAARRYTQEYQAQKDDFVRRWQDWRTLKNKQIDYDLALPQKREEYLKTTGETEKQAYERTQRELEERKRLAETQKTEREVRKPDTVSAAGTQFERPYVPGGAPQPYVVSPGLPEAKEEPLTQDQAEAVRFVMRTRTDVDDVATKYANGKILADPVEAARASVPGVGNILASKEYRAVNNAMQSFASGYMKLTSGAAITPSEAALHLPAYIPRAGDDDAELARKAQRRREFIEATEKTAGKPGLDVIRKHVRESGAEYGKTEEGKLPPVRVETPAQAIEMERRGELKRGRRIITPEGEKIWRP
jgi:hypothetical protein